MQTAMLDEISTILTTTGRVAPGLVTPEKALAADLNIDSVTMVSVVVAVEDHFEVVIPDTVWAEFVTVGDLLVYLGRIGIAPAR